MNTAQFLEFCWATHVENLEVTPIPGDMTGIYDDICMCIYIYRRMGIHLLQLTSPAMVGLGFITITGDITHMQLGIFHL